MKNNKRPKRQPRVSAAGLTNSLMTSHTSTVPLQPPPYVANLRIFPRRFRFRAGAAGEYTITPAKLGSLVCTATGTNTLSQWFESIRVLKITIWGQTSADEVAISFPGTAPGSMGASQSVSDTGVGMTRVPRVSLTPAPLSQAAQWQSTLTGTTTGASTLFAVTVALSSIIDVVLEANVTSDARASQHTVTIVNSATVGQIYYLALDNPAGATQSGSSQLVPVSNLITIK